MSGLESNYQMTIDGMLVTASQSFKAYNPATRAEIAEVPDASRAQLDDAVAAARAAFDNWRYSSWEERAAALNGIADVLEANGEAFMALLTRERSPASGARTLCTVSWNTPTGNLSP